MGQVWRGLYRDEQALQSQYPFANRGLGRFLATENGRRIALTAEAQMIRSGPMTETKSPSNQDLLERIASALERLAPPPPEVPDLSAAEAFLWHSDTETLSPVPKVARVDIGLLKGVDRLKEQLLENTQRFAKGFPANNAPSLGRQRYGQKLSGESGSR